MDRTNCALRPAIAVVILVLAAASPARGEASRSQDVPNSAPAAFAALVEARGTGVEADVQAAIDALARYSRVEVRSVLERASASGMTEADAGAGLAVLERLGTADDLALAEPLFRTGFEGDLERAVLAVARRDGRSLAVLDGLARTVPTEVRIAFLRAVEQVGSLDAAAWIARCGERSPDVRREALARLGRLTESLPHPAPREALDLVHGVLGGIPAAGLRDAVIAAGRMEDGDSVPYLIALLGEDDAGLRMDAAWSLQRITGLRLRERKERWEEWYATELAWWRDRSESAFADLESVDLAARTRALLEISRRQTSRDRLTLRVLPLLDDPVPETARLAAQTLRILQSKVACARLVEALDRPEPEVAREAWRALRTITRKDLPNEAAAWRAALGA